MQKVQKRDLNMMSIKDKYIKEAAPKMMKEFGWTTIMRVPRILKVVVNSGTGKIREKKDVVEALEKKMA